MIFHIFRMWGQQEIHYTEFYKSKKIFICMYLLYLIFNFSIFTSFIVTGIAELSVSDSFIIGWIESWFMTVNKILHLIKTAKKFRPKFYVWYLWVLKLWASVFIVSTDTLCQCCLRQLFLRAAGECRIEPFCFQLVKHHLLQILKDIIKWWCIINRFGCFLYPIKVT